MRRRRRPTPGPPTAQLRHALTTRFTSEPRNDDCILGCLATLILKRGEERRLAAGHPWVFSNEVDTGRSPLGAFGAGALVKLHTHRGAFVGYAYVNPHALICARIISRDEAHPIDRALITARLASALNLRRRLIPAPYYRWVFGESDGLPGLVLDRYGEVVVGQIATAGMEALKDEVAAAVREVVSPAALYWKNDGAARALEQLPQETGAAFEIGRASCRERV